MSFKLIKQATIIDPNSPHSKMVKDILIENGVIVKIDVEIKEEKDYLFSSGKS